MLPSEMLYSLYFLLSFGGSVLDKTYLEIKLGGIVSESNHLG